MLEITLALQRRPEDTANPKGRGTSPTGCSSCCFAFAWAGERNLSWREKLDLERETWAGERNCETGYFGREMEGCASLNWLPQFILFVASVSCQINDRRSFCQIFQILWFYLQIFQILWSCWLKPVAGSIVAACGGAYNVGKLHLERSLLQVYISVF